MKKLLLSVCAFSLTLATLQAGEITKYVNPFIGTGAIDGGLSGNNYPGATSPFGMIQLSPDTSEAPNWGDASGYDYNRNTIFGFSHTRLSGTGASDLIDITLMPTSSGRTSSAFTHDEEKARPGYYQVMLKDENINAELTTTQRNGIHRYQYPAGKDAEIILDMDHSADKGSWGRRIINSQIRILNDHAVEGYRIITGWAKLRKIYFYMEFSSPILTSTLRDGGRVHENTAVINGTNLHGCFRFGQLNGKPLTCKVALSSVSMENARQNMEQEAPHWDFDRYVAAADADWEKQLGKIEVKGTEVQKEIFYTALYHTMIQPNTMSDVNGEYMAADYTTRKVANNETHYTTFSLWDTFRASHPLYTLLEPERVTDFVKSMIRQYEYYGYLPIWQLWGQDNYCMIGNHSIPVITDAILKGIPGIDMEKAYEAVYNSSVTSHPNSPFEVWEKYGFMPENIQTQSVSITLEQAFDDWCVAQLAAKLNKDTDYQRFHKRSEYYRNLFHPKTKFFQSKNDKGEWIEPFDPYQYGGNGGHPFTEGNAWQYFWYVPHNIQALMELTGGTKAFEQKLDTFFTSTYKSEQMNHNASGFVGQYAHGNEPSHHVAYLYNFAGQPWKTQKYVSHILNTLYNNTSSGYAGNDDCGQMSAWYVFSAMGFYPVNPADGRYIIGSPLLDECTLKLAGNKEFRIRTIRKSPEDIYIQSVTLNGKKHKDFFITHQDIMNGGTMVFKMGKKPSGWGK
ncbi:glycoside hydrolase family 92 protein [Bacteroides thetaiotaomicron]|uniref:Glycoside hydrolase family 92 protein n=1 Tax=Bacteroides thetaiotaomicron TaxID=818 RepID=A0A7J5JQW2_BACT4|nr:GH92 family glycosyl hydrolase [Bacteroides thetaiotaomicron]KAB4429051.1 glycoside hydrolase family 92 protein [Bacteroides thetaiotaomicron]KAB4438252.1 glycoside hydrolase family 92 protein [Bacteroides thetaiotaomicron]KAB4442523.1 glycoside hydrolase family 92 protein [Bacteroides thetaiotaomicron]KAB4453838.1 glycoside hydrolase family 92 protein [Bacteroides thetaiotaomicron]RYT24451.1 glycoside hydrolase family 92 protein [Bacteroides thetaiotaomicron]